MRVEGFGLRVRTLPQQRGTRGFMRDRDRVSECVCVCVRERARMHECRVRTLPQQRGTCGEQRLARRLLLLARYFAYKKPPPRRTLQ